MMFLVLYIVVGTVGVTPLVNFLRNKRSFVGHILNRCLAIKGASIKKKCNL